MTGKSGGVNPARGEIWEVDLNPTVGREQVLRLIDMLRDDAEHLAVPA